MEISVGFLRTLVKEVEDLDAKDTIKLEEVMEPRPKRVLRATVHKTGAILEKDIE